MVVEFVPVLVFEKLATPLIEPVKAVKLALSTHVVTLVIPIVREMVAEQPGEIESFNVTV